MIKYKQLPAVFSIPPKEVWNKMPRHFIVLRRGILFLTLCLFHSLCGVFHFYTLYFSFPLSFISFLACCICHSSPGCFSFVTPQKDLHAQSSFVTWRTCGKNSSKNGSKFCHCRLAAFPIPEFSAILQVPMPNLVPVGMSGGNKDLQIFPLPESLRILPIALFTVSFLEKNKIENRPKKNMKK